MQTYGGHMEQDSSRYSILYIETDIPPQMTCSEWRRSKALRRRGLLGRLRARRAAAVAARAA
jgi:hypothetical protein